MDIGYAATYGKGDMDFLTEKLGALGIVDIGTIIGYEASTNRATVLLYNVIQGQQVTVRNVEVLFAGGSNSYKTSLANAQCLVVYPRTPISDTKTGELGAKKYFDHIGVKCIPLCNNKSTAMTVSFDPIGEFNIAGDNYAAHFGQEEFDISLKGGEGHIFSSDGELKITHGKAAINIGSDITMQHGDTTITFSEDGSLSINTTKSVTVTTEEVVTIDGDMNITGTLTVDGNLSAANGNLVAEA